MNRLADTPVEARMAYSEVETMMCYLLRVPPVFLEAKQVLNTDHFTSAREIGFALCWRCALDLYDRNGELPPKHVIATEVRARIAANPGEIPRSGEQEILEFLDMAYGIDSGVLGGSQTYGFELLQRFLKERHFFDKLREMVRWAGSGVPSDLPALLRECGDRLAAAQAVSRSPIESLIPDSWEPESLLKRSTGLPFLDLAMGGGWADGEVYGILGTFGSGKTMLACQIGAEATKYFVAEAAASGTSPRRVHYFTYETPPDEIRRRVISYVANIKLDHLEHTPYEQTLSRMGNRHPYEEEMFPEDPRGEWERYQDVMLIKDVFHVSNMAGPRDNPKSGSGWIDEIQSELEKWNRFHNCQVGLVIIDYAVICARRYIRAKGWDEDRKLRHLVGSFGDECRRLIADYFRCGVWVLNQLSGVANRRGPTAKLSHADSAEATNFAENLWYAFCLGNKDRESGCVILDATKTRRSKGLEKPIVLQLQGDMARFVQADDRYTIDSGLCKIVPRQFHDVVRPSEYPLLSRHRRHRSLGSPIDGILPL